MKKSGENDTKKSFNKGEWSELYAFIKLLKDGKIYAANEYAEQIQDMFLPILKIIRCEIADKPLDYTPGKIVKIFECGKQIAEIEADELAKNIAILFEKIYSGSEKDSGAFPVSEIEPLLSKMKIEKVKASSHDKSDITMQIRDIYTGFSPTVGFSIKSDIGKPPTLMNASKSTRIKYEVKGISSETINKINAIDKTVSRDYLVKRIDRLFEEKAIVEYCGMKNKIFEDNLIMVDSLLPRLYGELVLNFFRTSSINSGDCKILLSVLENKNPLRYNRGGMYRYKFKKLLCAVALGMTPTNEWNGMEEASGGYIIVKKDGDIVCYHLYNRNFFEEYLLNNTSFDKPSASRHEYGFLYEEDGKMYIDLNAQIRFKALNKVSAEPDEEKISMMVRETGNVLYG